MDRDKYIDDYGLQIDPLFDNVDALEAEIAELKDYTKEAHQANLLLGGRYIDLKDKIAELNEMLDIAWDAVTEAGYEGFSNKLKTYMEKGDASTILDNYA